MHMFNIKAILSQYANIAIAMLVSLTILLNVSTVEGQIGTSVWVGGNGSWWESQNWDPLGPPGGHTIIDSNATVTLGRLNANIISLTLGAPATLHVNRESVFENPGTLYVSEEISTGGDLIVSSSGVISSTFSQRFFNSGTMTVTGYGSTISFGYNLENLGTINLNDSGILGGANCLNNGTINIAHGDVVFAGPGGELTGNGQIILGHEDSSLTVNNSSNTIRGFGNLYLGNNNGLIRAESGLIRIFNYPYNEDGALGNLQLGAGGSFEIVGEFSGGDIRGSGILYGNLINNGALAPGNSAGTIEIVESTSAPLNTGNFIWDTSGLMIWDLGDDALTSDLLRIQNDFSLSGSGEWAFTFVDNGWQIGQTYTLIEFGSTSLLDANLFRWTNGPGFSGEFALTGNSLQFTLQSVPEPSSGLLLLTVGMVVIFNRRRQS